MSKFDYKVQVYSKDNVRLADSYASVAVRLINNDRAKVLKMINDNGRPKLLIIQLTQKTAEELVANHSKHNASLENEEVMCNE